MSENDIPQIIPKTGVSADYRNEYAFWPGFLELGGMTYLNKILQDKRQKIGKAVRFYYERFDDYPQTKDKRVIKRIRSLNLIANAVNILVSREDFQNELTPDECNNIVSRVFQLIYGDSENPYRKGPPIGWERELYKRL